MYLSSAGSTKLRGANEFGDRVRNAVNLEIPGGPTSTLVTG
jgi:hypothetical protein